MLEQYKYHLRFSVLIIGFFRRKTVKRLVDIKDISKNNPLV